MKQSRILLIVLGGLAVVGSAILIALSQFPTTIHARIAEDGGFMPSSIKVQAGQPLTLRLISDDVEHTFAIGQNPMEPVLLEPHQPVTITLTFGIPGTYTFYEASPSSINFWRMRGVIEVTGNGPAISSETPLYVQLGLNLDEEHDEEDGEIILSRQPSAVRGAALFDHINASFLSRNYYVSHSPSDAFEDLMKDSLLSSEDAWDVVASLWGWNTSANALEDGMQLYQTNCAACHGETGAGDGQFAQAMEALEEQNGGGMGIEAPTDFTQPEHLLESPPAVIQGLLLRGGMGTGMPMWGTIFTDEQTWNLVAYLYSFQFIYR